MGKCRARRRWLVTFPRGGGHFVARSACITPRAIMSGWLNAIKTDAPEAPVEPNAPSAPTASSSVTKVVVDTNAIVKGFRLERFADEAVTIPEVLAEVRDRQARHTLATLPFELKVQDPDADSIAAVRRFAKLTGDIGALSEPDVRCIALAYMLERDAHGTAHLRTSPTPVVLSKHKHNKASKMAGWDFVPNQDDWAELDEMNAEAEAAAEAVAKRMAAATVADDATGTPSTKLPKSARIAAEVAAEVAAERGAGSIRGESDAPAHAPGGDESPAGESAAAADDDGWERNVSRTTRVKHAKREQRRREAEEEARRLAEEEARMEAENAERRRELDAAAEESAAFFKSAPGAVPEGAEEDDEDDDEGDDEGEGKEGDGSDDDIVPFETTISSVTADYAMQNVILQMNMKLLTPDGMRITNLRRWVLRCHACQEVTRNTERVFCPKCGNASLTKVEHTVTADGVEQFGVRRKHVLKGTRFTLPMPKGGRREKAPILREDQLIGMRARRNKDTDVDVFAAEYNEESFAGGRAVNAGAAHLYAQKELLENASGGNLKKNPNERRFVRTNRRRK